MSIGQNLKKLRKFAGITQGALADIAGIQLTQVSRIESGDTDPKASTIIKLANALGCTTDELLMENNYKNPAYIRSAVLKIEKLTPLKRYVALDSLDAFCRMNTVERSEMHLHEQRYTEEIEADIYDIALEHDTRDLRALVNETGGLNNLFRNTDEENGDWPPN